MLAIFIQDITAETKLTRHWNVRDQIDTIKKLGTEYVVYPLIKHPNFLLFTYLNYLNKINKQKKKKKKTITLPPSPVHNHNFFVLWVMLQLKTILQHNYWCDKLLLVLIWVHY